MQAESQPDGGVKDSDWGVLQNIAVGGDLPRLLDDFGFRMAR